MVDKNEYKQHIKEVCDAIVRNDYSKAMDSYFKVFELMDAWLDNNKKIVAIHDKKVSRNDPDLLGRDYELYTASVGWMKLTDFSHYDADTAKLCLKYKEDPDAVAEIIHKHKEFKLRSISEDLSLAIILKAEIISNLD